MKQILNYSIHDIVKFQITRNRKVDFRNLINLKFSSFQVDKIDKPDIILNIGKFVPANQDCYLIDHKYYIKDNYFYCRDSDGKASWEVEIIGFERGDTIINFNLHNRLQIQSINFVYVPLFFPQAFLFRIVEHKLNTKGYFLAHGGAMSKDNYAYLLSGRAGCFKTTLCMDFVRHAGFTWLGDERVILYQDRVLGFPMNSLMFQFMIEHLSDETHWGFCRQLQFAAECLLGKYQGGSASGAESAKLKAVLLIAKSTGLCSDRKVTFSPVPQSHLEQSVDGLILSSRLEDFKSMAHFGINSGPFLKYILAYTFVFPNNLIATQQSKLAENLRNSLEKIPVYKIKIPPDYSPDIVNQINEFIIREC